MTVEVVNHETGELVETITRDEAQRLTTEALNEFRSATSHQERGWEIIEQAVRGGGHIALGYTSPTHYLHSEFDGVLAGLDIAPRRLAVRSMTEWGISTRGMAPVLRVSPRTAAYDAAAGVQSCTPPQTPGPAIGGEAVTGSGQTPKGEGHGEAPAPRQEDPNPRPPVTGIDGKTYPAAGRARPRPAAERTLNVVELYAGKAARAANDLTPEQIRRVRAEAGDWTAGLRDSLETLQGLLTSLTEEK